MNETPVFTIETYMTQEDYRKFLYLSTFRRSPTTLLLVLAVAVFGAIASTYGRNLGSPLLFAALVPVFFGLAVGAVCLQVEHKNKKHLKFADPEVFTQKTVLHFYEEAVALDLPYAKRREKELNTKPYADFFLLMESKDYFFFFASKHLCSLLRKQDIPALEAFSTFIRPKFEGKYRKI